MDGREPDNVIDLLRARLVKSVACSPSPEAREASEAILSMYDAGVVEASMHAGEVLIRLREGHERALLELMRAQLYEPTDPPHEGP